MSFTTGIGGHSDPTCDKIQCVCKDVSTLSISIWTAAQFGDEITIRRKAQRSVKLLSQLDDYGYSPLHYAAQNGHESIVKYLLSQQVPVDLESCGATPLHRAVYAGNLSCVKLLVEAGANVNAIDRSYGDGNTPAHKAILIQRSDILQYLTEHGADETIRNSKGKSVKDYITNPNLQEEEEENFIEDATSAILCLPSANPTLPIPINLPRCSNCHEESFTFTKTRTGQLLCDICRNYR